MKKPGEFLMAIFDAMKKGLISFVLLLSLYSCSKPYKTNALTYLQAKVGKDIAIDTLKFEKPEGIYSSYYDRQEYLTLKARLDSLESVNEPDKAKDLAAFIETQVKANPRQIEAWAVVLIYKARDKTGNIKTDTCRFVFDAKLHEVKAVRGTNLPDEAL